MAASKSVFYQLPREMRDEIYRYAVNWRIEHDIIDRPGFSFPSMARSCIYRSEIRRPRKRTPVLIIALRGDQVLYREALQVFYAINTFEFSQYTCESIFEMAPQALQTIRAWKYVNCFGDDFNTKMPTSAFKSLPRLFLAGCVNEIRLEYVAVMAFTERRPLELMEACVRSSGTLRRLILELSERYPTRQNYPDAPELLLGKFIATLDRKLGVVAKLLPERKGYVSEWLWEAKRGETLKWRGE